MLFLLVFQDLYIDPVDDSEFGTHDCNSDVCASTASSSRSHRSVSMSNRMWKLTKNLVPQDILIDIRTDPDMQRCSVGLREGNEILCFGRQYWVDAAMGFMVV